MCGVATIPFVIWYSKPRREWARRSSSGCQSSSCNIAVTLDILSTVVLVSNPYVAKAHEIGTSSIKKCLLLCISTRFS